MGQFEDLTGKNLANGQFWKEVAIKEKQLAGFVNAIAEL